MSTTSRICRVQMTTEELVEAALAGDDGAWRAIVARYRSLVWKVVNGVTNDAEDRKDAYASTWLRLAESLDRIRDPERLAGWLRVTAGREAMAVSRARRKAMPVGADGRLDAGVPGDVMRGADGQPEDHLLDNELAAAVRRAFELLDPASQELLRLLVVQDPPATYAEVGARFGRSHGWIGPTRGRCLIKLREILAQEHPNAELVAV